MVDAASSGTNRREQILQALAAMLETNPGSRITTAALAAHVGVSEAALYRHFPSKAKMIEGLITFAETTVFDRIGQIVDEHGDAEPRCGAMLTLLLAFCERNPGFARLFAGDALQGETDRLRIRMRQFYDRIETQLRQVIREAYAVRPTATTVRSGRREPAAGQCRRSHQPVRPQRVQGSTDPGLGNPVANPGPGGVLTVPAHGLA